MGNHSNGIKISEKDKNNNKKTSLAKPNDQMSIKKFNKINVVGKGGFGKVNV